MVGARVAERSMTVRQIVATGLAIVLIVGLSYWLTLPNETLAVGPDCEIITMEDRIAAAIHPQEFWQSQLFALREAREGEEALQAKAGYGSPSGSDKIETPIERRMDRLSDRTEAEARSAQQARIDSIAWMTKCEGFVADRVKE
jgi:hypothetical protein